MLVNMNESFALGNHYILKYQVRLCIKDVNDLRTRIIVEALLLCNACGCVHRPQKSPIRVDTEGVESTSTEVVGAVEGL